MNDLVKFGGAGLPANPEDLVAGLQNVGQSLQGTTGGLPFLRLLKSGVYAYGPENIEPEEGSEWAMNPASLSHGWACWGEGELLDERMVPFNQRAPAKGELPDLGHPWGQQVAMQLQCLNGEDTGTVVLYKGTAIGLRNAVKELINDLIRQLQSDPQNCVPVVELECDSYQHKTYGQIFYPVLNIVRWVSYDGTTVEAVEGPDPEPRTEAGAAQAEATVGTDEPPPEPPATEAPPPASNRRRRRKPAQEAASEPKTAAEPAEAPTRRRRRRAS